MRSILSIGLAGLAVSCGSDSRVAVVADGGLPPGLRFDAGKDHSGGPLPEAGNTGSTCSPGTAVRFTDACGFGAKPGSGIPNADEVAIEGFALPQPMTVDKTYSLSFRSQVTGMVGSIEIWGTDAACGHANELLWWGDMQNQTLCAEFIPTRAHSRLLFVQRTLQSSGNSTEGIDDITLCGSRVCPAGATGHGLAPGVILTAPLGSLSASGGGGGGSWDFSISGHGHITTTQAPNSPGNVISSGIFRLPEDDPFSDAWYCIGGGTFTANGDVTFSFSFQNITKLGTCAGKSGSGNAHASIVNNLGDVTSTFPELSVNGIAVNQQCANSWCRFDFFNNSFQLPLDVTVTGDAGTYAAPTLVTVPVAEASWFVIPNDGGPIRMACSTSGSVDYVPQGTTTIQLDAMSAYLSCPGAPADRTEFDGQIN